ncbi:uncharacterized protein M6B38_306375 [Iris pallida]|uniref:Uncharacterized protein n=1 Tax=Iris pallida TaxID=29817 RepID=A0AAX6HL73_IRIPA|nr:uncharacterized protein M6B38_306375 [Iris pallida]
MSSVDHKCPLLTTNVLCDHKPCTKSSSTCSSFLIIPLGPSCPMALFRSIPRTSMVTLPWNRSRFPNQTYYTYLKLRYAKGNRSTNSPPVGQTSQTPKIQYKHNR